MIFSSTYRNLSALAILLAAAFCACSSVGGDKLLGLTSAPFDQSGAVMMLQADGGAPPPPLPPTRPPRTA
jgi:hypothetical protein